NAWNELIPVAALTCCNPQLRAFETQLRQRIFWHDEIKCDRSTYPFLEIPWQINYGNYGVTVSKHRVSDAPGASMTWDAYPLQDLERDLPKLRFREPTVDRAVTAQTVELADDLFGDLLPPRLHRETYWWTHGLTIQAVDLVGLENLMLLMYDQPDGVHRLMAFLRDDQLNLMRWFEREGLLHDNCRNDNIGSGGAGHTDELPRADRAPGAPVQLCDLWGFSESQETVGVSPAMFAEFIFPYQNELSALFGLNYYGCCEGLHERWEIIRQVPRLRCVSVSPWADQARMAAQLGRAYVYCRKPLPTLVCGPTFDEEGIRADLRATLAVAGHLNLQIILKDTHTVHHEPGRIGRWVQLAREELFRYQVGAS
ncbi:MAG: hypothetical protein NTV22_04500, partial [bacterium]|nr:hypothetical protein [bacterium]